MKIELIQHPQGWAYCVHCVIFGSPARVNGHGYNSRFAAIQAIEKTFAQYRQLGIVE